MASPRWYSSLKAKMYKDETFSLNISKLIQMFKMNKDSVFLSKEREWLFYKGTSSSLVFDVPLKLLIKW